MEGRVAKAEISTIIVKCSERLEGVASILEMLEEKAQGDERVSSSELAAVRSVIELSVEELDSAWEKE